MSISKGFIQINKTADINKHVGWWNSLVSGDFDNDGDVDYIAGNLGLNSNYKVTPEAPVNIFCKKPVTIMGAKSC